MRRIFLFLIVILGATSAFSQNTKTLLSSNENETVIKFTLEDYFFKTVQTPNGEELVIEADEASNLLLEGAPDLLKMTASVIIPDKGNTEIKISTGDYVEYTDIFIAPSKGNLTRDINPNSVPYTYGKVYQSDDFFPGNLADVATPYIMRDHRGQAISVYPFQYNPVTKTLRIYSELTVTVSHTTSKGVNEYNRTKSLDKISYEFDQVYKNHFINYNSSKYTPVEEEGNMLIICYDDWTTEMQAFVDWKNTIGRPCEMVTVTDAGGSASAIATYVENYYNDNGLAHLLLVGDSDQVPTNSGGGLGGDSDNAYAYILGSDHYLDFFVGRFSAESAADVETQVERTISYENGSTLGNGWLNVTTGIASAEGTGDDNEYDWEHMRNIQTELVNDFTYIDPYYEIYDGSQGGYDEAGNATPAQVASALNTGTGIINYTGHGSDYTWVSSGFSNSDIDDLTNDNKLPFIWSVACVNGNFVGQTCFGEAWMRATNGNNPTGAIGIYASTINQSWDPPMAAQDEMVDLLVGSSSNGTKRTFAGLAINGCHLMNDEYSDFAMTDTWTCFGDPSLLVRTDDPVAMSVTHDSQIIFGGTTFTVNTGFETAYACISKDGEIIGTASGSTSEIPLDGLNPGDEVTLAVTGFNKITYITNLMVIAPEGPYVTVGSATINGNTTIDFAQTANIDITLTNVGPDMANGVTATLTTSDEYVTSISNNTDISFGNIEGNDGTATSNGSFSITVANNVPDQHVITFDIAISDDSKTLWENNINITVNAPVFTVGGMTLTGDDDNNGRLDPGETADLTFTVNNVGHADAEYVMNTLLGDSPYMTVLNNNLYNTITAAGTVDVVFNVEASEGTPQGSLVNLTLDVTKNNGAYTANGTEELTIGIPPEIIVGEGTEESGSYPFYTYWENNKTQILYLGSEIGAGTLNIQELGLDFSIIGGETEVQNLSIKFMETNITSIGSSYEDMSSATEVFTSSTYTMPTETGWQTFDVENFEMDATANNLLIEIVWGDNGSWSSPAYKLNSTTTAFTSVAYGYADDETPPAYDGSSDVRPNAMFFFEGEAPGDAFDANFTVTNGSVALTDATVIVGSLEQVVDGSGQTSFNLYEGDYYYSVIAPGYANVNPTAFSISGGNEDITVNMSILSADEIEENIVSIYPNPTTGILNVELAKANDLASITIFDLTGKVIMTKTVQELKTSLDLSNVANGIYILKIQNGAYNHSQKIIIK